MKRKTLTASLLLVGLLAVTTIVWLSSVPTRQMEGLCVSRLHALHAALSEYYATNNHYPESLRSLIDTRFAIISTCQCPFLNYRDSSRIDYVYEAVEGLNRPGWWWLAYDPPDSHPDGFRNVLHLSGEVTHLSPEQFAREYREFLQARQLQSTQPNGPQKVSGATKR
jgi:hypothetical protein